MSKDFKYSPKTNSPSKNKDGKGDGHKYDLKFDLHKDDHKSRDDNRPDKDHDKDKGYHFNHGHKDNHHGKDHPGKHDDGNDKHPKITLDYFIKNFLKCGCTIDHKDDSSSLIKQDLYSFETEYRTIDGVGNNLSNPLMGSAGINFIRNTPADYGDGLNTMSGADRPSARVISNAVFSQDEVMPNSTGYSNLFWLFGQFIDHDLDLTMDPTVPEFAPILVPKGDPHFDPFSTGTKFIPLNRSGFNPETGDDVPREQMNVLTSFIDASNVYGSDPGREAFLRGEGGKLKVSEGDMMPYNDGTQANAMGNSTSFFVAGDVRANENTALTMIHTIFVREHNRLVDEIAAKHPEYDADKLYNTAKVIVEAQMQAITFNEFLPLLLGENAVSAYSGYKPDVDVAVANIFATAAFRLGHTMLSTNLHRMNEDGSAYQGGDMSLRDVFFRPDQMLVNDSPESLFRGMAATMGQELDAKIINDVRNFLFGPPGAGGLDLVSLNIQRGRDHGLPDYNAARMAYGLIPVFTFADITSDVGLQQVLQELYGDVNNIDVFVGGLAEDRVEGSLLGELFHTIVLDQFIRVRDGDRFWYEARLPADLIEEINDTTLGEIIMRNTDIDYMQSYVFYAYNRICGDDSNDVLNGTGGRDLLVGLDGNDVLDGGDGDDELYGGNGHDVLKGGAGNDILHGEAGNDILLGGDGNDKLYGGAGNDVLKGEDGDDKLYGEDGNDKLFGGKGDDIMDGGKGDDAMHGGEGDDTMKGGKGSDDMDGDKGDDTMHGGDGDDVMKGGQGDDTMHGGDGDDVVKGGPGDDIMNGDDGCDILEGGEGDDIINGGAGNDQLKGGAGDDILNGGAGNDLMTGGQGSDKFSFKVTTNDHGKLSVEGTNGITDFSLAENDRLIFDGVDSFAVLTNHINVNSYDNNFSMCFSGGGMIILFYVGGIDSMSDLQGNISTFG